MTTKLLTAAIFAAALGALPQAASAATSLTTAPAVAVTGAQTQAAPVQEVGFKRRGFRRGAFGSRRFGVRRFGVRRFSRGFGRRAIVGGSLRGPDFTHLGFGRTPLIVGPGRGGVVLAAPGTFGSYGVGSGFVVKRF